MFKSFSKLGKLLKVENFKNLSIIYKLYICFSFIISLLFILSVTSFTYYKNDKSNTTLATVHQMNSQTIGEIDSNLENLINLTKMPLFYYNSMMPYISNIYGQNSPQNTNLDFNSHLNHDSIEGYTPIYNMMDYIFSLKSDLHSVFMFNLDGTSSYKLRSASLLSPFNPSDKPWFSKSIKSFGSPVIIPTYVLSNVSEVEGNKSLVYGVSRAVVDINSSQIKNIILINEDVEFLENMLEESLIYENQKILLVNNDHYIVSSTNSSETGKTLNKKEYNNFINASQKASKKIKLNGLDCLVTTSSSSLSDWKIINIIPVNELNKNIDTMKYRTYFLTIIFILIAFAFLIIITKQIVNPLKSLSNVMKLVEKGYFDITIDVNSKDEIGHLSSTFNSMTKKIKALIREVYINKLAQKDMEIQMLQNQINPHFIYNTLESIHMMAEINNDKESAQMATTLGSILRYGLSNNSNKLVKVIDEINNLKSYIMLQEIRFDNIENIVIDIDEELFNAEIMKLTFQPIVENSLYHGLSTRESGGILNITGHKRGSNMQFEISDNGVGMTQDQTKSLNGYINNLNQNFKSIGLKNVNSRIKLHYGNEYGLTITSEENVGTIVKILMPYKLNNSSNDRLLP